MNENGINIVNGFRTLRKFCGQVSLLLTTADGLMQELDWRQAAGSTAIADLSKSVHSPDGWLPCYFCRFYEHSEYKHLLVFISVLVEEIEQPELIDQAIVTAGWIDYGVGNKRGDWQYWFSQWHLWMSEPTHDGRLREDDTRVEWKTNAPKGVLKAATFAHPLDEITSGDVLKERIVTRLVAEIDKAGQES